MPSSDSLPATAPFACRLSGPPLTTDRSCRGGSPTFPTVPVSACRPSNAGESGQVTLVNGPGHGSLRPRSTGSALSLLTESHVTTLQVHSRYGLPICVSPQGALVGWLQGRGLSPGPASLATGVNQEFPGWDLHPQATMSSWHANRTCRFPASGSPASRRDPSGWSTRGAGRVNQGRGSTHSHVARRVWLRRRRVRCPYSRQRKCPPQRGGAPGYPKVLVEPAQLRGQHPLVLARRVMHVLTPPRFRLPQEPLHALRRRLTLDGHPARAARPQVVRAAQAVDGPGRRPALAPRAGGVLGPNPTGVDVEPPSGAIHRGGRPHGRALEHTRQSLRRVSEPTFVV